MSDQPDPLAEPDADTPEAAAGSPQAHDPGDSIPSRPKRRKQRRKSADKSSAAATPARDELDQDGRERPRFLLDFPSDPELEQLITAFENGNYARVRELAPKLVEHADSIAVREAAREIRRRIEPDPLLKYLLFASSLLLAVLVWYAYTHHGVHAH